MRLVSIGIVSLVGALPLRHAPRCTAASAIGSADPFVSIHTRCIPNDPPVASVVGGVPVRRPWRVEIDLETRSAQVIEELVGHAARTDDCVGMGASVYIGDVPINDGFGPALGVASAHTVRLLSYQPERLVREAPMSLRWPAPARHPVVVSSLRYPGCNATTEAR